MTLLEKAESQLREAIKRLGHAPQWVRVGTLEGNTHKETDFKVHAFHNKCRHCGTTWQFYTCDQEKHGPKLQELADDCPFCKHILNTKEN